MTGGKIGLITVTVPWNALMTNDSSIEVADLFICLRPVQRQSNGTSMLESMWSSVSSSMQLAQECMNQNDDNCDDLLSHNNSIDGLEKFAETIDHGKSILYKKYLILDWLKSRNFKYIEAMLNHFVFHSSSTA